MKEASNELSNNYSVMLITTKRNKEILPYHKCQANEFMNSKLTFKICVILRQMYIWQKGRIKLEISGGNGAIETLYLSFFFFSSISLINTDYTSFNNLRCVHTH